MVFYRKYRPQTIDELDSNEVRERLYSALSSKDVMHAFLFTGPKGLGKTSAARIMAKAVNCERRNQESRIKNQGKEKKEEKQKGNVHDSYFMIHDSSVEPCNKCYQCISITNGTNIDILEIDGASNRGIDEVRELREKIRLAPAKANKKVYIIDEVHMLTTEAFNALLKTLEEPPNHVIFVLCTTEPHKVPETIVSRCFHIPFKKATIEELVRSFERIAEKEKLIIDREALDSIASLSDGSFRDGAKILEEVALVSKGNKITKEFVDAKYQKSNIRNQISKMIEFLSRKNTAEGLRLVSGLVEQGEDMKYLIEQLMDALHGLLLYKAGVEKEDKFSIFNFQFSIEEVRELVELLSRAHGELKYAVLPQLSLELVIVEWGIHKTHVSEDRGQRTEDRKQKTEATESQSSGFSAISHQSSVISHPKTSKSPSHSSSDSLWQELINKVKVYNHSIAGVLRGCTLRSYDSKKLIIETGYKFHKERLEEKKTRRIIEKVSEEIVGRPITVSVILRSNENSKH